MEKFYSINIYKKVIEPKLKDWVIFEHGTCVIIYHPSYVSEDEGEGKEDYEIGLLGRNQKELDAKELKPAFINGQR